MRRAMKKILGVLMAAALCSATDAAAANCNDVPSASELRQAMLAAAKISNAGGLFQGARMRGAVVNRDGEICAYITTTNDPTQVWPGRQAIAKAKAYTAIAFSLDVLPLSMAQLYTFTQPGHSLWNLGQSNLWNPAATAAPGGQGGNNQIAGGLIFFGGGVPLYKGGKIVGGLGISGDTSCTDHEIAKRTRNQLALNPPGGATADDIQYGSSVFAHPKCINTYKNGVFVGEEAPGGPY